MNSVLYDSLHRYYEKNNNIEKFYNNIQVDNKKSNRDSSSELLDNNFHDEEIDKRSLSELRNKFDELNSLNWHTMTKAQKDLREKLVKKIQSSYNS